MHRAKADLKAKQKELPMLKKILDKAENEYEKTKFRIHYLKKLIENTEKKNVKK